MRPVRKGSSPIPGDFKNYKDAKTELISRISLGTVNNCQYSYCSYCETPVKPKNLAVEHIKFKQAPKNKPESIRWARPDLEGRWNNYLLSCSSCNSIKGTKSVFFKYFVFPDRDNTFSSFVYKPDGEIKPNPSHRLTMQIISNNTLSLVGLNKIISEEKDSKGKLITTERKQMRMEAWLQSENARKAYESGHCSHHFEQVILSLMLATGYFSVWMTVFKDHSRMKNLFIDSVSGTRDSGCFDLHGDAVNAHSNLDKLEVSKFKNSTDKI